MESTLVPLQDIHGYRKQGKHVILGMSIVVLLPSRDNSWWKLISRFLTPPTFKIYKPSTTKKGGGYHEHVRDQGNDLTTPLLSNNMGVALT